MLSNDVGNSWKSRRSDGVAGKGHGHDMHDKVELQELVGYDEGGSIRETEHGLRPLNYEMRAMKKNLF